MTQAIPVLHSVSSLDEAHSFSNLNLRFGFIGKSNHEERERHNFNYLKQVHGVDLVEASRLTDEEQSFEGRREADALYSFNSKESIAVITADCLPIFVSDETASFVLGIHAGWRGLSSGIIKVCLDEIQKKSNLDPKAIKVFLGPAISFKSFQVGPEVIEAFRENSKDLMTDTQFQSCYQKDSHNKFIFSLKQYAFLSFISFGIKSDHISSLKACTLKEEDLWYSYRRKKESKGRNWSWVQKV